MGQDGGVSELPPDDSPTLGKSGASGLDLNDWYEDMDVPQAGRDLSKGSEVTTLQLLSSDSDEAVLLSRLLAKLNEVELTMDDVPAPDSSECTKVLEEIGFTSVLERTKVRKALKKFRGAM